MPKIRKKTKQTAAIKKFFYNYKMCVYNARRCDHQDHHYQKPNNNNNNNNNNRSVFIKNRFLFCETPETKTKSNYM